MGETSKYREFFKDDLNGFGIDLGCGNDKIKPDAIGLDRIHYPCVTICRKWNNLKLFNNDVFDYIYTSHFLEHLHNPMHMLDEMKRCIKPYKNIIIILPDKNKYKENNPEHLHMWSFKDFKEILRQRNLYIRAEFPNLVDYSFGFICYKIKLDYNFQVYPL